MESWNFSTWQFFSWQAFWPPLKQEFDHLDLEKSALNHPGKPSHNPPPFRVYVGTASITSEQIQILFFFDDFLNSITILPIPLMGIAPPIPGILEVWKCWYSWTMLDQIIKTCAVLSFFSWQMSWRLSPLPLCHTLSALVCSSGLGGLPHLAKYLPASPYICTYKKCSRDIGFIQIMYYDWNSFKYAHFIWIIWFLSIKCSLSQT